tara:strand:+ start:278 stop:859 length:582 start_codon:yes stop_codon:yes gene_type:complete
MGKPTLAEIVGKLTAKQKKFAEGLVYGGLSKAESYRQAYRWNGNSAKGMMVDAVRASQSPRVSLAVQAMGEEKTARWWSDKTKLQTFVMEGLTSTAQTTESDITKLKAYELLGRTRYASIFEEPQANESTAELHGSIVDTIQARLAMLLSSADTIDITPTAARGKARRGTVSAGDGLDLGQEGQTLTGGGEGG